MTKIIDRLEFQWNKEPLYFSELLEQIDYEDQANLIMAIIDSNQAVIDEYSDRFEKMIDRDYAEAVENETDEVMQRGDEL